MVRYVLAPTYAPFADALQIARTLPSVSGLPGPLTSSEAAREPGVAASDGVAPASATPEKPAVAITFDDGPHPQGTPRILDILAQHGAKATFFVVGEQVVQRPQLLLRMVDEGHAVALHGFHHRLHLRRTAREMEGDFRRGVAAIQDAAGVSPARHRPPYGIYSPWSLRIARERGLEPLLWSAWGKDWRKFTTGRRIAHNATVRARTPPIPPFQPLQAGDVILLHDADFYSSQGSHERAAAALPKVLATLHSAGFDTVLAV